MQLSTNVGNQIGARFCEPIKPKRSWPFCGQGYGSNIDIAPLDQPALGIIFLAGPVDH